MFKLLCSKCGFVVLESEKPVFGFPKKCLECGWFAFKVVTTGSSECVKRSVEFSNLFGKLEELGSSGFVDYLLGLPVFGDPELDKLLERGGV